MYTHIACSAAELSTYVFAAGLQQDDVRWATKRVHVSSFL